MKSRIFWSIFLFLVVIGIFIVWSRWNASNLEQGEEHLLKMSFLVPSSLPPECFPIEIVDYYENVQPNGDTIIFGRTVWHKDVDEKISGQPVQVPMVVSKWDLVTHQISPQKLLTTNAKDGNFIIVIPRYEGKFQVDIQVKQAKNCPQKYKAEKTV